MAVNIVPTVLGPNTKAWSVEATADGDTTAVIAHEFGEAPAFASIVPIAAAARVSLWTYAANATNITLTKATGAGSGAAGAQVLVMAQRPHSMVK